MLNGNNYSNPKEKQADPKIIRDQINKFTAQIRLAEKELQVIRYLLENKITNYDDVKLIKSEKVKRFLEINKYIIYNKFLRMMPCNVHQIIDNCIFILPPNILTNIDFKEIPKEKREYRQEFTEEEKIENLEYIKKLALDNHIQPPKENDLSIFKGSEWLYYLVGILHKNYQSYANLQKNSFEFHQRVTECYRSDITKLEQNIYETSQLLIILKQQLETPRIFLIQSPNHLYNGTKGLKQNKKLIDFAVQSSDFVVMKLLFKNIAPEIYLELEKEIAVEDQKNAIQSYVIQNSEEIIAYISGEKLKKIEDIIFSAFRALAIKAFQLKEVDSPDRKITVKTSDFFRLCNLKNRKGGGYDTNQKTKIKELLKQESNLLKPIFYENGKSFVVTSFIKYLYWNNDNTITFEIDSMFFVNREDGLSFFCEDIEGRNRLTSEMPNSEAAYKLHKYFSYALKSPTQEFNVTLLLQKSGLIESYNSKHQNRALEDLQKILDTMFEVNTIIKDKPIRIASASDNLGKYKIVNSRYKEIKAIEQQSKKKGKKPKLKLIVKNTNK